MLSDREMVRDEIREMHRSQSVLNFVTQTKLFQFGLNWWTISKEGHSLRDVLRYLCGCRVTRKQGDVQGCLCRNPGESRLNDSSLNKGLL